MALILLNGGIETRRQAIQANLMSAFDSTFFTGAMAPSPFNPNYLKALLEVARACHGKEPRKQYRMVARSLYWHAATWPWFRYIAGSPFMKQLCAVQDNLPEKLHRDILRIDNPIEHRLQLLLDHYQLAEQLLDPSLYQRALLSKGATLSHIAIDAEHHYLLQLAYGAYPGKEGELSVRLYNPAKILLARISFSFLACEEEHILCNDGHSVYIGGVQGANSADAREAVNQASKACYGLAPRRMVIEAILAIAQFLQSHAIHAVADRFHTFRHKKDKYMSYDVCWSDLGGSLNDKGDFSLPLVPSHKDYEDTPRKRRAKYRRQQTILAAINQQVKTVLAGSELEIRQGDYLELK